MMLLKIKKILSIVLAFTFVIIAVPQVYAQTGSEIRRYVVILEEPALYSDERPVLFAENSDYNNEVRKALIELQNDVKSQIPLPVTLNSEEDLFDGEYSYTDVLNGFTITTDEETAEIIRNIDGVKEVFPDEVIATVDCGNEEVEEAQLYAETEETYSLANSGSMINAPYAYENGYTGEGRTVAILDSTLYCDNSYFTLTDESKVKYTKESLAEIFSEKGMSFTADDAYKSAKVPFAYDYADESYTLSNSKSEHGTHVSGIATGNKTTVGDGIIRGVAPEAQILFFGVVSSSGSIAFSIAAKALDDAVKLGADTINMSFGEDCTSENQTGSGYTNYRTAIINAENAGCNIANSAGNKGKGSIKTTDIDYSTSSNIFFPNGSKVGSVYNNYRVARKLTDENGNDYASEVRSSTYELSLTEIVNCGSGTASEINSAALTGKVAVISKPDDVLASTDYTYFSRAKSKSATAVILIDNDDQISDTSFSSSYTLPFFLMTKTEGEKFLSNATQVKCEKKLIIGQNSESPMISDTSAYGYSDTLDISVDFSAPGGNIYSAFSYSFMPMSGTSMASPHVAGAQVLMNQYLEENYPGYTGKEKVTLVKNLLASTAATVYEDNGAIASVRQTGSGIIQLDKAMQTKVILNDGESVSRVTLGDNIGKEFTVKFYAENISDTSVTFDSVDVELSTDDYKYYDSLEDYAFYGIKKLNAVVSGDSSVTVEPHSSKEVTVTVTLSDEDIEYLNAAMSNGFFVDGKVTLSNTAGEHVSVGIPFTGFYGDWEKYTPVDEDDMNIDFLFRTEMDYATIDNTLIPSEDGYVLPFTTDPDEYVKESSLSHSAKVRKNTYVRIKADGKVIYNNFIRKNKTLSLATFVVENGAVCETLKKNGKVVWEFYFMSPLHKTESEAQLIKITVTPQNEMPSFSEITVTESGGTKYLYVYANGANPGALVCVGHDESGTEKVSNVNNNNFAAFGIDGLSDATLMAYDSALNSAVENPGITVSVENNKAIFKNNTFEPLYCTGIIAVYGTDGKMEKIDFLTDDNTVIEGYHKVEKDLSEYMGKTYKIFFWEDKILKPIL